METGGQIFVSMAMKCIVLVVVKTKHKAIISLETEGQMANFTEIKRYISIETNHQYKIFIKIKYT